MKDQNEKALEIQETIRQIFLNDWDPTGINGFGPSDEYDSYIESIYRLLVSGASEYQIIERLYQHQAVDMGMNTDRDKLKPVAEKLKQVNTDL